ncbi:cytochrome c/FTR1 family iron permease [Microbulbifer thermotolerans]|uniref:FTR1 family protein n=1 Tax=Microbulbifer thermotolerans TaxID=252514 RepID=A0AB35HVZ5_MICTH|nr:FTR1 family protein [Microbulbifer thermotolerans]MCX2779424.1 FTR1 family protein [Microbulbifer thermotolerans]MCX2796483.1 FTR1 family protein [Microbulbifer thermotolerans]MCX2801233.1 FTR1 family protein [Microbulbifer thermotolerans]MCX2806131.1 FTR1 family protein [Microbulbifer thermotolerans]MCX2832456.1 FTR1 family protein [Microbulbifer thermotolerans]
MPLSQYLRRLLAALFFLTAIPTLAQESGLSEQELRQLMQLAEYIGVDYSEAVENGEIINGEEYAEMEEFADLLVNRGRQLTPSPEAEAIRKEAQALQTAIGRKASLSEVQTHTAQLRQKLLAIAPTLSLPQSLLSVEESRTLYRANCVACHGDTGMGDGPLAAQLEPPPTNFHERERAENRSLLGLYDAISNGIDGTAMASFSQLTEQQRWSLAFYVGSLAFTDSAGDVSDSPLALQDLVMYSPQVLHKNRPEISADTIAALRADPTALFEKKSSDSADPMDTARGQLQKALAAYLRGDYKDARTFAVSAYLDGFELLENTLDSHDADLRRAIESDLLNLRAQLNPNSDPQVVEQQVSDILQRLDQAGALLQESSLSDTALFIASLIILLREGLEALLVVIALTTILVKTQRRDALKYVHIGWISAFIAGFATWVLAQQFIAISGASREVMEGVAALLAAAVLFYVGFWMHSKTQTESWQKYIQESVNRSLTAGTLWGIAGLAFIAVYREIFETILFYQSLLTQTAEGQYVALWTGVAAGAGLLAVIGWILVRYSARLPLGKFFSVTTLVLLALSFVLAGKAIAALQEAALIGISPMPISFSFDWLGIYSTWQGIGLQAAILVAALWLILKGKKPGNTSSAKAV